ncbi:putative protein OS=Tsukamurella paurometabola (strain ATCC 8368 / DSM / CCUG 35730 /CIP 100753 / JCM 10117 / KCTC 9821 / NBRC 16120 / NCIMB 702349/ NCTC 13040) OX=521096 GN=Tpau_2476 PE=4 SV=1 [Tsukamurella paurometabola]|uniref:Uncharacterized protein n=1 Tax=Tsukamurella paurometabola (strain ATCC 8368 / DSM 20162 / CCUG 35730 / CIP 100753 / JCM 10117 / KCTC 9821 / NBRC 16120 / NCIMB 702349 / NCTC 13040) TaxID=521096 RepID=D5UR92_TSUPD|nr:hypothetical protein Tpau_2476 [Tsukamurella paurometabola DSM 20162]SUP34007.1 Uncharacterised protein [Tsukamurella paurometabola]
MIDGAMCERAHAVARDDPDRALRDGVPPGVAADWFLWHAVMLQV